jgi:PHP family Zn ribbon phosphoesterase
MNRFKADLHNHSCLSPCGSLELSPGVLASRAKELGIDMLALTDHNNTRNLPAFEEVCRSAGIKPLFGTEVTSSEEVHVLCLFDQLDQAMEFGRYIEFLLPDIPNMPDIFGDQVIVDAKENVLDFFENNLLSATSISFEDLVEEVLSRDGLVIPAHIDRMAFSAVSQLGFLPDLPYSAVEVLSYPTRYETYGNTIITDSDAHEVDQIGQRSFTFTAQECSYRGLKEALEHNRVTPAG